MWSCSRGSKTNPNFQHVNKPSRISPLINEWSGGEGGGGVNFLPLKRGFIIEGV